MKQRKVRSLILWIAVIIYLIVVLAFVAKKRRNTICQKVNITILDSAKNFLLNKQELIKYIDSEYKILNGSAVDSIDVGDLSIVLGDYPLVKNTKVYKTISGEVNIELTQRKPIMRIINDNGQSFYIDDEGVIMPFSSTYTAHVLVINGNIKSSFDLQKKNWVDSLAINAENFIITQLYDLGKFIYENEFLSAQINQVYINELLEFELVPRVGQHIVFFGKIENYKEKLQRLEVFYKEILPRGGWNKYKSIDLSFNNQIVCKKK
jgi:cell division protein FtsQ